MRNKLMTIILVIASINIAVLVTAIAQDEIQKIKQHKYNEGYNDGKLLGRSEAQLNCILNTGGQEELMRRLQDLNK